MGYFGMTIMKVTVDSLVVPNCKSVYVKFNPDFCTYMTNIDITINIIMIMFTGHYANMNDCDRQGSIAGLLRSFAMYRYLFTYCTTMLTLV